MNRLHNYIDDVISGKQVVGRFIRLAVERHLKDLERTDWLYEFDESKAAAFLKFFEKCYHWKGEKAGTLLIAEPHQVFYFAMQFGWRNKETGLMRFDKVFKTVARKNAKTTEEAVKALYHLAFGNEPGAQVWCGATKREQAYIVINDAGRIAEYTPQLKYNFKPYRHTNMIHRLTFQERSFMAAIGQDSKTEDGLDPSWIIIDEYHAHPDDCVLNILDSGRGSRKHSVVNMITTAGFNQQGPCYSNKRKHAIDVLEGRVTNDRYLALLFEQDPEDDWMDEACWVKSNPNMNVSVRQDYLQSRFIGAKNEGGTSEVDFKTKNLNMWVGSSDTWINDEDWMANVSNEFTPDDLVGATCYGGFDLANISDTISFSLFFPSEPHHLLTWYFIPEETVAGRIRKESVNYLEWVKNGQVTVTQGNVRDDDEIIRRIDAICKRFTPKIIGFDDWESYNIVPKLVELGHNFVSYPQNYSTFNMPIKEFYKMVKQRQLNHFGNPVTRWQISNVALQSDDGGRVKFSKRKASDKIDGPVSAAMAIGCWLSTAGVQTEYKSVYADMEGIE